MSREGEMGLVIRFPLEQRIAQDVNQSRQGEPASIVILPVIRIERYVEEPVGVAPGTGGTPGRGRRPRATR
jgi:hypothetical protein